jgi:ATP-dependent helicase/nuclease subunit A
MVKAGAGAGKTTALTDFVISSALEFKKQHDRFPQIVLTTFTRKATQELRERIIRKALTHGDPALLEDVSSKSKTFVSTIHGVLSLFLKRYAHLMGLDPNFSLLTSIEERKLTKRTLRELVLQPSHERWLELFDMDRLAALAEQYARLQHTHKDLRAITVEDMTTDFYESIHNILARGEDLLSELLCCDEKKFVEYGRILEQGFALLKRVTPETFPILAADLRENFPRKPSYSEGKTKLAPTLHEQVVEFAKQYKSLLESEALDLTIWAARAQQTAEFLSFLREVVDAIESLKRQKSMISIDDLERLSLMAQKDHPILAQAFSQEFDLWLLDEFQDTSPIQIEILRSFIGAQPRFVVGDPQQSIYLFRGARTEVFENYQVEMQNQNVPFATLETNYRSTPELLLFFNKVFTSLGQGFAPMKPRAEPDNTEAVIATFSRLTDDEQEAEAVLARLQQLASQVDDLGEICVLGRTNLELRELALAASRRGLPIFVHQTKGFFGRREILDALAILKFLVNPYDNENLILLLRSPWFRISDAILSQALSERPPHFFFHLRKILANEPGLQRLEALITQSQQTGLLAAFEMALREGGFFERAIAQDPTGRMESNLWKLVHRLHAEWRRPGFSLIRFVREEAAFRELEDEDEGDAVSTLEPNRINFMTVHAAKGLQFAHVLLPGMGRAPRTSQTEWLMVDEHRQICSVPWPQDDDPQKITSWTEEKILKQAKALERDEHWRVFYVAITRAKESVHFFMAGKAQKNSWAERLTWLTERPQGRHDFQLFQIEILEAPLVEAATQQEASQSIEVRKPWSTELATSTTARKGITALLKSGDFANATFDLEHLQAAQRGVELHRFFENYRFHPDVVDANPEFAQQLKYVLSLREPPLRQLLKTAATEWGFQVQSPLGRLEGQMDLMGEVDGVHWIIDYKTGSARYQQRALEQLQVYGWCLAQRYPTAKIRLAAIFTAAEVCVVQDYDPQVMASLMRVSSAPLTRSF